MSAGAGGRLHGPDVAAGLALAAFMAVVAPVAQATQARARPVTALGIALLVCCGCALAARRAHPVATYAVMVGAAVAYLGLRFAGWPVYLGAFTGLGVLVTGVASARVWVPAAAAGGLGVAAGSGAVEGWRPAPVLTIAVVWAAVAALGAREARTRRRWLEEEAGRRQVEERLRIARELHDVLSHSLASISLQAGVGLHLVDARPEQARSALSTIRTLSTEALGQARAALAAVRGGPDAADGTAAPGLGDLPELFASAAASGLRLDWRSDVDGAAVPDRVAATAYRVAQEALTNAMRHAGDDARVRARLGTRDGWLEVEVVDDGRGAASPASSGAPAGHGLRGMAERVRGAGGRLQVGPLDGGGFAVRAQLPLGGR